MARTSTAPPLPWLNLWFSERTLLNVRNPSRRKRRAKRFEELRGGRNKMTVGRFEAGRRCAGNASNSACTASNASGGDPIPVLRELMTGALTCILKPSGRA
jgi:hypothetical protein